MKYHPSDSPLNLSGENQLSKKTHIGLGWVIVVVFCVGIYWPFWSKGLIPAPFDTLVGAYYPYLDYKWGNVVGVAVKNSPITDVFSTFYVWKYLAVDQFKSGKLPIWNPYVFSGTPLLATFHSAVLFPGNLLLFLPKPWSWGVFIFGSTLVSVLTMYLFLGKFTNKIEARVLGAVVFGTSGLMTTWVEFGTAVWALAIWPILFLLPVLKTKRLYLIAFTVLVAAMILAGNVQLVTYAFILLPVWIWYLRLDRKYYLMLILGIILTAIQWLPTINLYTLSIRNAESRAITPNFGLTPTRSLVRFWAADFFGNPVTGNFWDNKTTYHEYSGFLGTIAVVLILSNITDKKQRPRLETFWVGVTIICLGLLIDNPISRIIFSLPLPLLTYSSASRLLFVVSLAGSILAAKALDSKHSLFKISTVLFMVTIGAIMIVPQEYRNIAIRNSLIPLGLLILTPILKKYWVVGLVGLCVLDLGRYFGKYNPFVPPVYAYPKTPVIEYLESNLGNYRFFKQKNNLLPLNTWTAYKLRSPEGYDPLHLLSYHQEFNKLNNKSVDSAVSRYVELDDINTAQADKFKLKYYVSVNTTEDQMRQKLEKVGWQKVFTDKSVSIYENPNEIIPAVDNNNIPNDVLWGAVISGAAIILIVKKGFTSY